MGLTALLDADPASYVPHPVHRAADRTYVETNCYTDVVVELLHARGDEALGAVGSNVRLDFEGDQWSFFKPDPHDLELLYGVDVHEMQPYRPLPEQVEAQLATGRTMSMELDAWWLPDTAATSYRREHVKTTVIAEGIDRAGEVFRYFHNAGLHELSGEDYREVFAPGALPPYCELIRFDAGPRLEGDALRDAARERLAWHLARRPRTNPFERFGFGLERDLPALLEGDPATYHAYAFATVRMAGSGFELLASEVEWLFGGGGDGDGDAPAGPAGEAVAAMREIVGGCKLLSLKLARRRAFETAPRIADLARAWERATGGLDAALA
ncbi:MAG TPA: DUF1839 family protein [Baekduia sp.]|uniref:DUF1839 family protein n=1 Tax=Baekduia sp. TaxID=2600305 RepID=UPI002D780925|nr:DUF1839 family protein [Baekduia sp.]HET6508926.1 DUF1839 family protein [Baekduia sp.]